MHSGNEELFNTVQSCEMQLRFGSKMGFGLGTKANGQTDQSPFRSKQDENTIRDRWAQNARSTFLTVPPLPGESLFQKSRVGIILILRQCWAEYQGKIKIGERSLVNRLIYTVQVKGELIESLDTVFNATTNALP